MITNLNKPPKELIDKWEQESLKKEIEYQRKFASFINPIDHEKKTNPMNEIEQLEMNIHILEIKIKELQLEQDALKIELLKKHQQFYIKALNQ